MSSVLIKLDTNSNTALGLHGGCSQSALLLINWPGIFLSLFLQAAHNCFIIYYLNYFARSTNDLLLTGEITKDMYQESKTDSEILNT